MLRGTASSSTARTLVFVLAIFIVFAIARLILLDDRLIGCRNCKSPSSASDEGAADPRPFESRDNYYPVAPHAPGSVDTEPLRDSECTTSVRIFDVVSFFNEIDMYEIRVGELFDVVDIFITVESNTTFQGHAKPVLFETLLTNPKQRFPERLRSKLHNYQCGPLQGETNWDRERHHRRCMQDAVAHFGAAPHDLVVFGDADEIPSSSDLRVVQSFVNAARCRPHRNHIPTQLYRMFPMAFRMTIFFYNFRWISRSLKWTTDLHMFDGNPRHLQRGLVLGRDSEKTPGQIFFGKGWHCSWCFNALSKFRNKFDSYSHSEFKSQRGYTSEHLLNVVCKGDEIFKWAGTYAAGNTHNVSLLDAAESLGNVPKYLRENRDKFSYLLPMGNPPCDVIRD